MNAGGLDLEGPQHETTTAHQVEASPVDRWHRGVTGPGGTAVRYALIERGIDER